MNVLDVNKLMFENKRQMQIIEDFKKKSKEKQNTFDSFGLEHKNNVQSGTYKEPLFDIKEDKVLSGSHVRHPNTIELSHEYSRLEKSIGRIRHNRTISNIKFPRSHKRMESVIKWEEVFQ